MNPPDFLGMNQVTNRLVLPASTTGTGGRIRTYEELSLSGFGDPRHQPLGHTRVQRRYLASSQTFRQQKFAPYPPPCYSAVMDIERLANNLERHARTAAVRSGYQASSMITWCLSVRMFDQPGMVKIGPGRFVTSMWIELDGERVTFMRDRYQGWKFSLQSDLSEISAVTLVKLALLVSGEPE